MMSLMMLLLSLTMLATTVATLDSTLPTPSPLRTRVERLRESLMMSPKCHIAAAAFRIVQAKTGGGGAGGADGKADGEDDNMKDPFCLKSAEDFLLPVSSNNAAVAVMIFKWKHMLGPKLSELLSEALSSTPFWLSQAGSFIVKDNGRTTILDHWSEGAQLSWLVAGCIMRSGAPTSNATVQAIDAQRLIHSLEARQRLLRWVEWRKRYGFTGLDSGMVTAALVLLLEVDEESVDPDLFKASSDLVKLILFELSRAYWKGVFLAPKMDENSAGDFNSLLWLLHGDREMSPSLLSTLMLLSLDKGTVREHDLASLFNSKEDDTIDWTEVYGVAKEKVGEWPQPQSAENCLFWTGQAGNPASPFRCFHLLGNGYNLWQRHPLWSPSGALQKFLPLVASSDSLKLERLMESWSGEMGDVRATSYASQTVALVSADPGGAGRVIRATSATSSLGWRLYVEGQFGGGDDDGVSWLTTYQDIGGFRVAPTVAQFRTTAFVVHNPDLVLPVVLASQGIVLATNLTNLDQMYTDDDHWFVGQAGSTLIALFSYRKFNWAQWRENNNGQSNESVEIRSDYASNVFIAHIETISTRNASRPFSALLQSVLNSALDVSAAYKDRFRQCLDEKRCLDDGPTRFLSCLRGDCEVTRHVATSDLAACLIDTVQTNEEYPHFWKSASIRMVELSECLSRPLADFELKWQLGSTVHHFSTVRRELRTWMDGVEVTPYSWNYRYRSSHLQVPLERAQRGEALLEEDLFDNSEASESFPRASTTTQMPRG